MRAIRTVNRRDERWHELPEMNFDGGYDPNRPVIAINTKETFQQHMGFGASFTEAAAYTFHEMPKKLQDDFIRACFDKETGLGYTLGRVHIHSSDFSLENYTYVKEGDKTLETFDTSREDKWVIPMIKKAEKQAEEKMQLLASPWSPPAYMKDNNDMNYGGKLLDEYKQTWAEYYVKFIESMASKDVNIWGVSIQNEPAAVQCWDSCSYTAEDERDFVKNYLGPTMHQHGHEDKAIIIWDHNRDIMVERAATVLSDPEAAKYVWGTGNHWYCSEAFENLSIVHHMFPDKHILFTEGCVELTGISTDTTGKKGYIGSWKNGETYGRNIMGDFNNWSEGWIDWNILLNEQGGPNHVHNFCEAPLMYDRNKKELMYNTSYYYIGHFSRYIKKDALRVLTFTSLDHVHAVSFKNPDGKTVIVVQNDGWITEMALVIDGKGVDITLPDNSITTYIL